MCWLLQPVTRNRVPGGAGGLGRGDPVLDGMTLVCEVRVAPRLLTAGVARLCF